MTGKAQSAQLERDSALIAKNPLLIQKTLADKLSDKIQVIVAPPQAGGFFAGGLIGTAPMSARAAKADGTAAAAERLRLTLTNDTALGVLRYADAGYEEARQAADKAGLRRLSP